MYLLRNAKLTNPNTLLQSLWSATVDFPLQIFKYLASVSDSKWVILSSYFACSLKIKSSKLECISCHWPEEI